MIYLICYEPDAIEDNYDFVESLKSFGEFQHPLRDLWFVNSDLTLEQINDKLLSLRKSKFEKFVIIELNSNNSWKGWMQKVMWKWLNKYLHWNI